MDKITYVTGNKFKVLTAKKVLEPLDIVIEQVKMDCPEIQANSIEEVAKYSSKFASEELRESVLKNDSGLIIPGLNNFPSAYTKYVEETIGEDGILKLMSGTENREAYFLEVLAYTELGKDPVVFISKTKGAISSRKIGNFGWSYDKIFIPEGETKTLAEFPDEERWKFWNEDAYVELAKYLQDKKDKDNGKVR